MSDHLGEAAALYALGALDARERSDAEEHLEHCDACRRLLAAAEADVTAMAEAQPQFDPPVRLRERLADSFEPVVLRPKLYSNAWLAAAAAIVIGLAPAAYLLHQNESMHASMIADADAMARVASGPHQVASFTGMDAKVMYGADGSWYCIVIRGTHAGLNVVWPHDGTQTMLGTASPDGDVALLYLPKSHRMQRLSLVQDGRVVGQAQLVF